ncbi:hypothetical protein NQ317_005050 [Molorchus minor]|uniref:Major facilitator superfamily (MFS) profile domain-containing protein n=1 Tax=Molorchus minor TaxID=1323400 RepID=A0ABQ9JWX8_9CUCU|nr:hypothetical protein NQ317_005050 [Molorchus minor]
MKKKWGKYEISLSKQVLLGLLTNFSNIAPSMSLGFSAVAIPTLKDTLNAEQISWFASIASLASPFGCFLSGPIADRFGRRPAMFCVNVTCFIGWSLITAAYRTQTNRYTFLLLGRLITGFSTGLSSAPATIYMTEVSSLKLRGVFTTWGSISFSFGILAVYFLGFFYKDSCGTISLITTIFPCVVPESPGWLVGKNRLEEAKRSMAAIFGTTVESSQVGTEIEALIKAKGVKETKKKGLFVKSAGVTIDPYVTIVMIGLIRTATAIVLSYVSKLYGKRPLSIFSGTGMTICMLTLSTYIWFDNKIPHDVHSKLTFLPVAALLFYFLTSTLGFLPLPFALAAELFPTNIRGTATGLLCGCGYLFNFITVKIYYYMVNGMGREGVFLFYGCMSLLGTIFVVCFLPETKGKTLQEIQQGLEKKKVANGSEMRNFA